MRIGRMRVLSVGTAVGLALVMATAGGAAMAAGDGHNPGGPGDDHHDRAAAQHVLLLSVDGMHQADLDWYVHEHPDSALAHLVGNGASFSKAQTPVPSDSFPGMIAQVTGGNPSSTGVYYDDTWNAALLPAGTTPAACATAAPGAEVTYFEQLDKDPHALDAGQGLSGLPGSILSMTATPARLIDPAQLPVDPTSCQPVYPHSYLLVNTVLEVARAAGLRTAWADKHPAYEILNGPSGTGIQDLFTPEINSDAPTLGSSVDWTKVNTLTQQYDSSKVQAVINEISGFDHTGVTKVGTPAIFGMNFQTVSTAQKLPTSITATSGTTTLPGGYQPGGQVPGPVLSGALDYVNASVGTLLTTIHAAGLDDSTVVVLSAKHGQSPQDPNALNPTPDAVHRGCHRNRHRRCRCTYPPEWLGTAPWAGSGRRGFGSRGPAAPGATAAAGGVGYFSCSRAAVRKMAPRRWVNSAWVVTSVVNQSSWLPSASFFSASTTDSSAAW